MDTTSLQQIFTDAVLADLFPAERTNAFFEALFGDAAEGAYDIRLRFLGFAEGESVLRFSLDLHERPGCCLVCSLTYGLPEVFSRHPVINIKGLVKEIEARLGGQAVCTGWQLGHTVQEGKSLHTIPLTINVQPA
jgi:hypothetical protein